MSKKNPHMDTSVVLLRKGAATRDSVGGISYAQTSLTVWAAVEYLSANGAQGAEFYINYDSLQVKDIIKLTTRNDVPAQIDDNVTLLGYTYEVVNVIQEVRSGVQEIYARRLK